MSYFVGLEGKSEDEISDMLLVAPRLDASMMRVPEILELLFRGLHAPSAEVRRFVLRSLLKHMPVDQLPERLWLAGVALLGDSNLGVAQTAVSMTVTFATSDRLAVAEEILSRIETQSSECSLRVLQVAVEIIGQKKVSSSSASVHNRIVSALLRADEEGDTDPLFAVATLEQLATCASSAPEVVYSGTGLSVRAGKKIRTCIESRQESGGLLAAAWLRLLGSCVVAGGSDAFSTFLKDGPSGGMQWALRVVDEQTSKEISISEALLDGALVVLEGVVIGSEEGCTQMSALVMRKVLALASNPMEETRVKVRCLSFVADVLEALNSQPVKRHTTAPVPSVKLSADSKRKILSLVEETTGLVARLLSMAQQPLLEDQREAVYRVLTSLIRESPQWTFQTAPSLAAFITGKMGAQGLDISRDTLHWRFRMAQEAFNHGRDALIQMVGDERTIEVITYLRGGMYGSNNEAKADVADQFAN